MKISVKSTRLKLTEAVSDYIKKKIGSLGRLLKKIESRQEIKVETEIARTTEHHRKGDVFYAEANVHLPRKIIRAEHSDLDVRAAIDKLQEKLKQEIKKYKEVKRGKARKKDAERRGKI